MPSDTDPSPAPQSSLESEDSARAAINRLASEDPREAAAVSMPTNEAPAEADTATSSNALDPALDTVIPSEPAKRNASARAKKPSDGKAFCPSQAKTKRFAPFHFPHF